MSAEQRQGFGWGAMIGMLAAGMVVGGGIAVGVMVFMEDEPAAAPANKTETKPAGAK